MRDPRGKYVPRNINGLRRTELLEFVERSPSLIKALDYFQVYADTGSQRAVADRRGTAPSTVSETMGKFEEAIGICDDEVDVLRKRIKRGDADEFLQAANQVLEAAERMVTVVSNLPQTRAVMIGTHNAYIKEFLADAISIFESIEGMPNILLPIAMGGFRRVNLDEILQELIAGQYDYSIISTSDPDSLSNQGLDFEVLYRFDLVLVAEEGHPLMRGTEVSGDDLVAWEEEHGLGLLVGPEGYFSRDVVSSIFQNRGKRYRTKMENPDTNTRVALSRSGYGVTIAHRHSIDLEERVGFPKLTDNNAAVDGSVVLAWRTNRTPYELSADIHNNIVESTKSVVEKNIG